MTTTLKAAYLVLLICAQCLGQSKYNNQLQPGSNTRDDAVRVLGQPLRALNPAQFEYPPPRGAERLVVEYRNGSNVIERIEAYFIKPYSRAAMLQALKLSQQADTRKINAEGKVVEYFGGSAMLVLTYVSGETSSGVASLGYYSQELFNRAVGRQQAGAGVDDPVAGQARRTTGKEKQSRSDLVNKGFGSEGSGSPNSPGDNAATTEDSKAANARAYEDLIARANGVLKAHDYSNAIRFSQQAVSIDPKRAEPYQIIGIAELYGFKDFGAAESAYRAAIDAGGAAAFGALHNHFGGFQDLCRGTLYVNKYGVSYAAEDGKHSFQAHYADIKEAGPNSLIGSGLKAFHIKVTENGKTRNYDFAPGTYEAGETSIILTLINQYFRASRSK